MLSKNEVAKRCNRSAHNNGISSFSNGIRKEQLIDFKKFMARNFCGNRGELDVHSYNFFELVVLFFRWI